MKSPSSSSTRLSGEVGAETPTGSQESLELWGDLRTYLSLTVRKQGKTGNRKQTVRQGPQDGLLSSGLNEPECVSGGAKLVCAWSGVSQWLRKIGRLTTSGYPSGTGVVQTREEQLWFLRGRDMLVSHPFTPIFPPGSLPSTLHPTCLLSKLGLLELSVHKNPGYCLWNCTFRTLTLILCRPRFEKVCTKASWEIQVLEVSSFLSPVGQLGQTNDIWNNQKKRQRVRRAI